MDRSLEKMPNRELWQLFPIQLYPHNPRWAADYREEAERIEAALGREHIARISHVGSTAVPGLAAKAIVDILLEVTPRTDADSITAVMRQTGYLCAHLPHKPAPHLMFMKGYMPEGFAEHVYHVHVRYPGDWNELYFRDYLRDNPDAARQYEKLKLELGRRFRNDRDAYTEAKGDFVLMHTTLARKAYGERYTHSR